MAKRKPEFFTPDELIAALTDASGSLPKTAKALTALGRGPVTVQLLRSWITRYDHSELGEQFDRAKAISQTRNTQAANNSLRRENRALADAIGIERPFSTRLARWPRTLRPARLWTLKRS